MKQPVAVIGGGNGAFAAAAHLTYKGLSVNLCDPYREGESLKPLMIENRLNFTGALGRDSVALNKVSTSLAEALADASMVILCVPTSAHALFARWLAPLLSQSATVLLNPGHTGGALNFLHSLTEEGYKGDLVLGETNTLTYIARKSDPTTVNISNIASNIHLSSLPGKNIDRLLSATHDCYPELQTCPTIIGTSLRNLNAMMHPPGMILAAVWVERNGGNWDFYYDGATPAVENLMQAIDDERLSIATAWGEKVEPLIDILAMIGTTTHEAATSRSLQKAFLDSTPNRHIKAPKSLDDRYMHEDIGYGLVPMTELARIANITTPVMDSLITIASTITKIDYRRQGLNNSKMGLSGKAHAAIKRYFEDGNFC
jgi:opine dehydrogenase